MSTGEGIKKRQGRKILHLDMDAFFASIEQVANPKLKNKPVIVGSRNNKYRTVVAAASYEAKACGIESGMSAREALRLCPEAIFVPADCAKYLYTAERILHLLQNFSPQVEMASIDEFYLDITGCEKLFGTIKNIAYLIKKELRQRLALSGSIGIAPNKLMAKIASKMKKPDGLVIWEEGDIAEVLKELPVEKLCGVGPKISSFLHQMGVFTCAQLANLPEELLVRHWGKYGSWLRKAARGEDTTPVELSTRPELPPKSVGHSYTLERNTGRMDELQAWIRLLCEMVAARLRALLLEGSVVHLYLRGTNLQWWSRQKSFSTPTFDGERLYQRSLCILKQLQPSNTSVRALGVSVSNLIPASSAYLFTEEKKRQDLLFALDKINQRLGEWTIYPAQLTVTQDVLH